MNQGKPTPGKCHVTAQAMVRGGGPKQLLLPWASGGQLLWPPGGAQYQTRWEVWGGWPQQGAFVPVKRPPQQRLGEGLDPHPLSHRAWEVWGLGRGCTQTNNGPGGRGRPHKDSPGPARRLFLPPGAPCMEPPCAQRSRRGLAFSWAPQQTCDLPSARPGPSAQQLWQLQGLMVTHREAGLATRACLLLPNPPGAREGLRASRQTGSSVLVQEGPPGGMGNEPGPLLAPQP